MKSEQVPKFEETELKTIPLGDFVNNFDSKRVPISKMERKKGKFPYYGASGIIDYVEDYVLDGEYLLISEDGENLRSRNSPIAFLTNGKFWPNNHIHVLQSNEKTTNYFLLYALNFLDIDGFLTGSAQPKLNQENLNLIPIPNFSFSKQEKIGKILHSLDIKITTLQKQNKILEQTAQAIFKSWFVDFDGVTEFEDSELGEIPKGWKISYIENISDSISKTHSFDQEKLIFLNTGDIKSGKILHRNYTPVKNFPGQAKKSIERNDILFTEIRPKNERYAFVDFDSDDYVVSTKLIVIRARESIFSRYLYQFLTSKDTLDYLQLIAETRSGTFPQITFDEVKILKILIPTQKLLEKYNKIIINLSSQIKKNWMMIENMVKIYDFLLPKLMSGEIRV